MNALQRAFADSQRSYMGAKATVSQAVDSLMARGPSGVPTHQPSLLKATEQLRHFTGWVYAAVRPIAQRIAGQPVHVGRASNRGMVARKAADVEPLDTHPILDLLADPNDLMVAWSLMYTTVASLELTGRSLWWLPQRKQILPIPTSWIRDFEGATRFKSFVIQPPYVGERFSIPGDECVYVAYPDPSDPHGAISPLQAVGAAVDADESITDSQRAMFRRGIHPSHAVIVGKNPHDGVPGGIRPRLTGAQQRQIISAIQKRYSGALNHGEPIILDGLIEDVKRLSNIPSEMDWLSSGQATKSRILQGFGANPIILGEIEGANRASATVADEHFTTWTVNPKIELLSQSMTEWFRWVFSDDSLVVWIEPCVPHDAEERRQWAGLLAKHSCITGDELRDLSPFDLPLGKYDQPVSANGQDQQVEKAMWQLDEALSQMNAAIDRPLYAWQQRAERGIGDTRVKMLGGNGRSH